MAHRDAISLLEENAEEVERDSRLLRRNLPTIGDKNTAEIGILAGEIIAGILSGHDGGGCLTIAKTNGDIVYESIIGLPSIKQGINPIVYTKALRAKNAAEIKAVAKGEKTANGTIKTDFAIFSFSGLGRKNLEVVKKINREFN